MQKKNKVKSNGSKRLSAPPKVKEPRLKPTDQQGLAAEALFLNAELLSRSMFAARLGMQFGGNRDLYNSFGYSISPNYQEYRAHYDRQGLATRAVEIFSDDTWNKPPVIVDGEADSSMPEDKLTQFLAEWNNLVKNLGVWQIMRQADVMCGIGRYSLIFLGAPGGNFSEPLTADGLFYLAAYDENQASIADWITDEKSERFGMPQLYTVTFGGVQDNAPTPQGGSAVHFSRVIHISENRLGSRVYGRPRLQIVLNRLYDLEKVTGGAAEAVWLSMYKGLIIKARQDTSLPEQTSPEGKALQEQVDNYIHQLQRFLLLDNADTEALGVDDIRVKETYDMLIEDFSGSLGIPKRILVGSERGELASSQDLRAWNGVITSRRTNFAEPEILAPFIDWCIRNKAIVAPDSGKWTAKWKPVFELNEIEKADVALKVAQGADALSPGLGEDVVTADEFRGMVDLPPRPIDFMPTLPAPAPDQTGVSSPAATPEGGDSQGDTGGGPGASGDSGVGTTAP